MAGKLINPAMANVIGATELIPLLIPAPPITSKSGPCLPCVLRTTQLDAWGWCRKGDEHLTHASTLHSGWPDPSSIAAALLYLV
jgi:hypothetical protein